MIKTAMVLAPMLLPAAALAQAVPSGEWDVTSTVVDLSVAGAPGFLLRMAKGKSKTAHQCVSATQAATGIAALLAPDPKAQCQVSDLRISGGHYAQTLLCPQKRGDPVRVVRAGVYDANGFTGRAEMTGRTPKGAMAIILAQKATRVGATCRR